MKRLAAVALMAAGAVFPAFAQHAAAHGGSSGHSAPSFHRSFSAPSSRGFGAPASGGFHAPAPSRFAGPARFTGGRPSGPPQNQWRGVAGYRPGYGGVRPPGAGGNHAPDSDRRHGHRRPYISPYGTGFAYAYPGYAAWYGATYLGYPDDSGTDDSAAAQNDAGAAQPGYDDQPADQGALPPWPGVQPAASPAQATPSTEEGVTLVFKDGRPPEQIHNYVLTPTTIYVGDQHRRDIPIDQLDLVETAKANRDAGVDFQLPTPPGS